MADWSGLFNSDDFRAYRKKQSEAVATIISRLIGQAICGRPEVLSELKGQLDVIHTLLKLPDTLTEDENLKLTLEHQYEEDISHITAFLVRQALREED